MKSIPATALLSLTALALAACAPAATVDPASAAAGHEILKPGQQWRIEGATAAGQGRAHTLVLAAQPSKDERGMLAFYDARGPHGMKEENGGVAGGDLWFDPLDSDPEFLVASYYEGSGGVTNESHCIVLSPSASPSFDRFQGKLATNADQTMAYLMRGNATGLGDCTLTLVR